MLPIDRLPRIKLEGDTEKASDLWRIALLELQKLKNLMSFQNLEQDIRRVVFPDGTVIQCHSVFGEDNITIYVPLVEKLEEITLEELEVEGCIDGWAYPVIRTIQVIYSGGSFSGDVVQIKRKGEYGLFDCVLLEYKNFNEHEFGGWIELSHPEEGAETWNWTIASEANGRYAIRAKKYDTPIESLRAGGQLEYAIPTRVETVILPKLGGYIDDNNNVTPQDDQEWTECQRSETGGDCIVNYYIVKSKRTNTAYTVWDRSTVSYMLWIKQNKEVELEQGVIDGTRKKITVAYDVLNVYGIWDNEKREGTDYSSGATWLDNVITLPVELPSNVDTVYVDYTVDPTSMVYWETTLNERGPITCSRYGFAQTDTAYLPSYYYTTCWMVQQDNMNHWTFAKIHSVAGLPKYVWKLQQAGYTWTAEVEREDDSQCSGDCDPCVDLGT
jgi:hypothetical protein